MSKMRMSGLISGMDTDSVIQQLVESRRTKVEDKRKEQTSLNWKQDIWKDVNKQLKSLMTKFAASMRYSTNYTQKKTAVSDSSVASVMASDGTPDSTQTLRVKSLAKSGYMTGGVVSVKEITTDDEGNTVINKSPANALSKMSELGYSGTTSLKVTDGTGNEIVNLNINGETSISDVLSELKNAGLNASFDEKNQRIFVSSAKTGAASDFTISADDTEALKALGLDSESSKKVDGKDAVIYLNDAEFKSESNVFSINGLTITALKETGEDKVTLTTSQDTSAVYGKIKEFLKEYNAVMSKLDTLYGAEKLGSKYKPLSDEEKETMSESEVEKYEQKIKDSLLSGDSTMGNIRNALVSVMQEGIDIGGEALYLSNFGIGTLPYFEAATGDKHTLHINGDPDDENTAGKDDKLKSLISTDPKKVTDFFTQLSQSLYSTMNDLSSSIDGYRSFGSFYEDKKMKADYSNYTTKISEMEEKVNAYEDKLYKRFASMETALAKLQKSTSAVTALLGGGQ
ncbi:MAG: flagellar filament capping protein FliD [Lachnospiraceae bacterium]|nr:flagellar filament capping protein FliD [Lachnospiraceae bacterium]